MKTLCRQVQRRVYGLLCLCILAVSCESTGSRLTLDADLGANRIEIQPFTKPASFDVDNVPDGISAWVQAHNAFGDPVRLVGDLVFELYQRRNASAERKGEQLVTWNHTVRSRSEQNTFWDRPSQSYQFELAWTAPPTQGMGYVLAVTLTTPDGQHLSDEYDIRVNPEMFRDAFGGRP